MSRFSEHMMSLFLSDSSLFISFFSLYIFPIPSLSLAPFFFRSLAVDLPFSLDPHLAAIERCFRQASVEKIFEALEKEGTEWAKKTIATMKKMSPVALKVFVCLFVCFVCLFVVCSFCFVCFL